MRSQNRVKSPSLATAIINSPSCVGKTSYGAMNGKAVPYLPGELPVRSASVSW